MTAVKASDADVSVDVEASTEHDGSALPPDSKPDESADCKPAHQPPDANDAPVSAEQSVASTPAANGTSAPADHGTGKEVKDDCEYFICYFFSDT